MNKPAAGGFFWNHDDFYYRKCSPNCLYDSKHIFFRPAARPFSKIKSNNVMSYFVFFELNNGVDFSSSFSSFIFKKALFDYSIIRFSQRASERFAAEILTRKLKSISDALSMKRSKTGCTCMFCGTLWGQNSQGRSQLILMLPSGRALRARIHTCMNHTTPKLLHP